jgi:outer membrane immunogenic protein
MRIGATISMSLIAMMLLAAAADATDLDLPRVPRSPLKPVPPVPHFWTGLYVGAAAGAVFGQLDHDYERSSIMKSVICNKTYKTVFREYGEGSLDADGLSLAAIAGYNHQFANSLIVGVEADLSYLGIDEERVVTKGDILRQKVSGFGSVRARIGYAFNRLMVYGTGGVGFARIENAAGDPANASRFLSVEGTRSGFVGGGGAEYAWTPNVIGRLEYLYFDPGKIDARNAANDRLAFDNKIHSVRVALVYKF